MPTFTAGQVLTAAQLNQLIPTGALMPYAGAAAPTGYLLCNGAPVSRTTYADLFAVLSTTYGNGNGTTTFNLPDLQQKFPMGKAASGTGSTLGGTGGSKDAVAVTHNHTQDPHLHTQASHSHLTEIDPSSSTGSSSTFQQGGSAASTMQWSSDSRTPTINNTTATNQAAGVSGTDANLPAYQVFNYIVKT